MTGNMMGQAMAHELQHEASAARKLLEAIPEDKWDYKPHEKSMTIGNLGSHIAESLEWTETTCQEDSFEMDPETYVPEKASNREELLKMFDGYAEKAVAALAATPDDKMMVPWKFIMAGKVAFEMPRVAVLRSFILSHLVHHRGQLSVYLRLLDVPVPQIYGPTADDPTM